MADKKKNAAQGKTPSDQEVQTAAESQENPAAANTQSAQDPVPEQTDSRDLLQAELNAARQELSAAEDKYLRLAAEYDNFRKRTAKEKESIWADVKADTAIAFLSVYDNLERAVKQACTDEAYAKGVEMTMTGLKDVMTKLGIEEIPALGETFDPSVHNAVMHVDDEASEQNTIVEVFQSGFRLGEKILRFAMVKVAN